MDADQKKPHAGLELRAASGPTAVTFALQPPGPATIGRRSTNALQLDHPSVSREHARLSFRPVRAADSSSEGVWLLDDLGGSRGTWLNAVRLRPNRQYHLRARDLIVIGPWTLQLVDPDPSARRTSPLTTLATVDDSALVETVVTRVEPSAEAALPHERLRLLLRCSERIHAARTEDAVVEAVLDAAVAGTGFTRAALLRPMSDDNVIEVMASRGGDFGHAAAGGLRRALIREAASSGPALLTRKAHLPPGSGPTAQVKALCVPVVVESTLAGFLHLDQPGVRDAGKSDAALLAEPPPDSQPTTGEVAQAHASSCTFPIGLARLAAMGLAGLMRMDMERRQECMEAELQAAVEAQRWLLPQRQGSVGPFSYIGATKQGRCVGGDFYDIIPLSGQRLAVILGDVGGKGIPVSVLVSASQGFVHASMEQREDPALAVTSLNHLYHSRISNARFLKLWIGVFDSQEQKLTYVDAGYGNAMTAHPDGRCELLPTGADPPVGMERDLEYRAQVTPLMPGMRTCIVSDGFVEQCAREPRGDLGDDTPSRGRNEIPIYREPARTFGFIGIADQPRRFGISGVQRCLQQVRAKGDEIVTLFDELDRHAGATALDDDATALVIRW